MTDASKLKPGVGVDVGTANIVVTRQAEDGSYAIKHHRNMLFEMDDTDDAQSLLSNTVHVRAGGKIFVVGSDALSLVNAIGGGDLIRPMKDGLLNPSFKEAEDLLFHILLAVVGKPIAEGERLRFSVPANPIDRPDINNYFHEQVLQGFFDGLGYSSKGVNEGAAVVYAEAPHMDHPDEGKYPLTGIGISWGAGMANAAVVVKGKPVVTFSNTRCGDYIDQQVSKVTGVPVAKVIRMKERDLDLEKPSGDKVLRALSIFYDEVIGRIGRGVASELSRKDRTFDAPIAIVNAGGTAMPKGFIGRLQKVFSELEFTFQIKEVVLSKTPFYAVSRGSCIAAQ